MSARWNGCADQARDRGDPALGTAPYAQSWLLLEHPGPWPREALAGAGLSGSTLRRLGSLVRDASARILLIRRPGRQAAAPTRAWAAVGPAGQVSWGRWREDGEVLAAAEIVRSFDSDAGPVGSPAPILLVCAHGQHDTCCAVRGRPVTAALARRWPTETWECSHVGGDRFAANLVVLPDGAYYGYLDPSTAEATVAAHLAGRLDVTFLRGLARYPPPSQVAIAAVHRRHGPWSPQAVAAAAPVVLDSHHYRVEVRSPAGLFLALVGETRQEPARLTCQAGRDTPATVHRVLQLTGPY